MKRVVFWCFAAALTAFVVVPVFGVAMIAATLSDVFGVVHDGLQCLSGSILDRGRRLHRWAYSR